MDLSNIHIIPRNIYPDNRGFFSEIFSDKIDLKTDFIQDNFSVSHKWAFRGLHFQKNFPQAKLVTVLRGKILDIMLDIREESSTFGHLFFHEISSINPKNIFIPRGFAHGFLSLDEETEIFYKVDNMYVPHDEAGFMLSESFFQEHFSDILKSHDISKIILSEKDKKLPHIPFPIKLWKL